MLLMMASLALTGAPPAEFPEQTPSLIEACLLDAVQSGEISDTDDSSKYSCSGDAAQRLWLFLEDAEVEAYEQDVGDEGHWLSREFPLGGCFKRVRLADGSAANAGLSCTIWIPRPAA